MVLQVSTRADPVRRQRAVTGEKHPNFTPPTVASVETRAPQTVNWVQLLHPS